MRITKKAATPPFAYVLSVCACVWVAFPLSQRRRQAIHTDKTRSDQTKPHKNKCCELCFGDVPDGFILTTKRCRVKGSGSRRRSLFGSSHTTTTTQLQGCNRRRGIKQHISLIKRTRDKGHVATGRTTLTDRIIRRLHHTISVHHTKQTHIQRVLSTPRQGTYRHSDREKRTYFNVFTRSGPDISL